MGRGLFILWMVGASAWAQLPKSQLDLQREGARSLEPAEIELRQNAAPSRGTLRVRVYAARDYRSQTFDWTARFNRIISRVNRALGRWPNVRLEIVEIKRWEHDSANLPLERLLAELEAADPGRDVDFVVGLAVAVPTLPEQIHNIGMARQLGRHFVIRSLHDLAEYDLVKGAFDQMSPPERERLLALRKSHKEVVVFLHELFHTLGLIHAQRWQRIMNPTYNHGQSLLSDTEAHMVELSLEKRDAPSWRSELTQLLSREPDPEWDPRDREQLRALLQSAPRAPSAPVTATADSPDLQLVLNEANAGRVGEAFHRIDTLLEQHPEDARMQRLGCQLAAMQPLPFHIQRLDFLCARAVRLLPDDAAPLLFWAEGQRRSHLEARADEILSQAEALLDKKGTPELWKMAASLRQALIEPTLAVADSRRAGEPPPDKWVVSTRRHFLLPETAEPAREGEYVRLVRLGLEAFDGKQDGVVELMARQLAEQFPRLPAAPLLHCALDERHGAVAKAETECREALALQEDGILVHRLLSRLAARRRQRAAAVEHQKRAEALESGAN